MITFQSVSPNIFVRDIDATVAWYTQLGFAVAARVPDDGPAIWVMMVSGSVTVMFQTLSSLGDELSVVSRHPGGSLLLYMQVKGIRELYDNIKGKVQIYKDLEKTFYGATEFSVVDPNNYVLTFAEDE